MIRHSPPSLLWAALVLLAIVCLGPLPFGSVLPRERLALEIGAFLALAGLLASRREPASWGRIFRPVAAPALALAAVGVFGLAQSLSWPAPLVGLVAPEMVEVWRAGGALVGEASGAVPLSLAPAVSRQVGIQWLAVAAALLAACAVGSERRLRRLLFWGLMATAVFEVVYGAENWFQSHGSIWGTPVPGDPGRARGTFVNPDHLALYLSIATAAAAAALWWSLRRTLWYSALERRLLYAMLPSLLFLLLFVGLTFTGSRAGLVAMAAAILVQAALLAFHYRRWQIGAVSILALVFGLGGVVTFGLQQGLGRLMATTAYEVTWSTRLVVYDAAWDLWRRFPWTGTGLGTFRQAFPQVQPAELELTWFHAHSDPLEVLVTTGVFTLPILGWGLWALVRRLWRVFQKGRRSEDRAAGLAVLGATVAVFLHSLVDFGLTMPANAFTFAIVCGLACGAPLAKRRTARDAAEKVTEETAPDDAGQEAAAEKATAKKTAAEKAAANAPAEKAAAKDAAAEDAAAKRAAAEKAAREDAAGEAGDARAARR